MRVRSLVCSLLATVGFAACDTVYGVGHRLPLPDDLGAAASLRAVRSAMKLEKAEEETENRWWVVAADGNAYVYGGIDDRTHEVFVWSSWLNWQPTPDVLERSLLLQRRFADALRGCSVLLPPLREWPVDWTGIEPNETLRTKVLSR